METKVVKINPARLELYTDELLEAADIIRRGGLVAFPTETVYGLGASALDPDAARRIYEAKGRPSDNPLIIHIAEQEDIYKWCEIDNDAMLEAVASAFMPGPITVIQKKKSVIPDTVTSGMDTVAVRCPSNPIARRLIELSGLPIAAPSANASGRPSPTRAEHVIEDLMGKVDMIIDGGECDVGLESTILLLKDGKATLLRPGGVTLEGLERVLGHVEIDKAVTEKLGEGEKPLAPGMKYRHYAPSAPVTALKGDDNAVREFMSRVLEDDDTGIICYREDLDYIQQSGRIMVLGSRFDKSEMAHRLFDCLRAFDSKLNIKRIYARLPETDEMGLALVNRLIKACGYSVKEL